MFIFQLTSNLTELLFIQAAVNQNVYTHNKTHNDLLYEGKTTDLQCDFYRQDLETVFNRSGNHHAYLR